MTVPFVDLSVQYKQIKGAVDNAISNVIEETAFIGGVHVSGFEQKFAKKYNIPHCISTANGTDSLYIIMKALGIGPGDEVITVANSWISSSETITQCGARPVFVDIDPVYYTIDTDQVEAKITSRTKAIIPVHLYGQMCDMDRLESDAKKYSLHLIEDCAQSHFSEYKGKKAGSFGVAGSFSFYPGKNLGAYGDAGALITADDALAVHCKMFARHGCLVKHDHKMEGINSRMDGIQAAILSVKLDYIDDWTEKRISHARLYSELLENQKGVTIPQVRPETKHSFHLYVIRVKERSELQAFLKEKGIETAIHYPTPLPLLEAYNYLSLEAEDFPVASSYSKEILSLPMYPEMSEGQIHFVTDCIQMFYNS